MKLFLPVFITILLLTDCNRNDDHQIKVITLNVRYDNPADDVNAWPNRKDLMVSFLETHKPDILGLQECLFHQYSFLDSALSGYTSIAAGRDDGGIKGEMTPLFFKSDIFSSVKSGTFWLSETTDIPGSRGWGAVLPRIVTWAELETEEGSRLWVFNTHFSHMSDSARLMSSMILRDKVSEMACDNPFIITGDFNMVPESRAYETILKEGYIGDSYSITESEPLGPTGTFNGFNENNEERRIDYIFVSKQFSVLTYKTFDYKGNNLYISDHWPVAAVVTY